jgi:hypothetical protein
MCCNVRSNMLNTERRALSCRAGGILVRLAGASGRHTRKSFEKALKKTTKLALYIGLPGVRRPTFAHLAPS